MSPDALLAAADGALLWPAERDPQAFGDLPAAYQQALAVRGLRIARGEKPRGFKIGFTNSTIWPRYGVFAPIWGTVWDSTLSFCEGAGEGEGEGRIELAGTCQPRLEPEAVFGIGRTPPAQPTLAQLFDCIEWMAPGFEVVQSHCPHWRFTAAETVADGALHARLLVGPRIAVRSIAPDADTLNARLASCQLRLLQGGVEVEAGTGANVLGGPLQALHRFVHEMAQCPGAPRLQADDVVTTGTWTDAWPIAPGQHWRAEFGAPLLPLGVTLA